MEDRLESIEKKQDQILLILTGNGNPEDGLSFKVHLNTKFRLFWEKFGWIVMTCVAGIPPTILAAIVVNIIKTQK